MTDPKVIAAHIDIANLGLEACGHAEMADFDDDRFVKVGALVRNSYNNILKTVMEKIPWDFATEMHNLTPITLPVGTFDYSSAYQIPGDVLKPYSVQGQAAEAGSEWIRRGTKIFSNISDADGSINCELIHYIDNVSVYPATFIDAVAARCAAKWAGPILRVSSEANRLKQESIDTMREAASSDGQVGSVRVQQIRASSVRVRSGGSRRFERLVDPE